MKKNEMKTVKTKLYQLTPQMSASATDSATASAPAQQIITTPQLIDQAQSLANERAVIKEQLVINEQLIKEQIASIEEQLHILGELRTNIDDQMNEQTGWCCIS